jgi:Glycosyl transferase family 2
MGGGISIYPCFGLNRSSLSMKSSCLPSASHRSESYARASASLGPTDMDTVAQYGVGGPTSVVVGSAHCSRPVARSVGYRSSRTMKPRFTILLPLVRPPVYLPLALEGVRSQSIQDFEVLIICDGAPPETVDYARTQAELDSRFRAYSFPKGKRFGEAHWHTALADACGQYVVHLEDDDLWFPNHLDELAELLSSVDFGHTLHTWLHADGRIETLLSDISNAEFRSRFLTEKFNRFGYSVCGYRLDAYRRLSQGWGPAPPDVWTDLHMWRRFFCTEGLTFGTRMSITAIVLADHLRQHSPIEERIKANQDAWRRVADARERAKIVQAAWASVVGTGLAHENASCAAANELLDTRKALRDAIDTREAEKHAASVAQGELLNARNALRDANQAQVVLRSELIAIHESRSWRLAQWLAKPLTGARGRLGKLSE